jgi:uncharacterized protein (DUF433 family)
MARRRTPPDTDLVAVTKEGLWRVAGTRVSVDSVVHAFWRGSTPEQIAQDYEALSLAQVYGVVHWYLMHRTAVDGYLSTQDQADKRLRRELATQHGEFLTDLRRRLDARRRARDRAA